MAKYYWKGSAAGFTTGVTGASYTAWIAATNAGLSANWAYSVGAVGSGVTGATGIPGVNDTVFISDRFPTLGSTLASQIGVSGAYTYVLSPCLNSSNTTIISTNTFIGPFSNYSISGLPLVTGEFGHSRVGGPVLGNSAVTETVGITGATLIGYPLGVSASSGIYIYDNDLGAYDINIIPRGTNTTLSLNRVDPSSGNTFAGAFTIADKPWKPTTALRIEGGSAKSFTVYAGVVLGELKMVSSFAIQEAPGVTAPPLVNLLGQIFNTTLTFNNATGMHYINVLPNIRCFDESAVSKYTFADTIRRNGDTNALSPQIAASYADLILNSALRAQGISLGTILPYTVILGTNPTEAEPAANTNFKFATLGSGTQIGAPLVKLRGSVTLSDFSLAVGRLVVDSTSIFGQQGVICTNGRISSSAGADLGGLVRLSPVNDELVPGAGIGSTYVPSSGQYGIRITEAALANTTFASGTTIETNSGSPFPS